MSSEESRESCQGRFRDPAGSARAPRAFAGAAGAASQPSAADTFPPLRSAGRPARDPAQRAQGAQAQARPSAAKRRARRRTGTVAGRMSARAGTRRHGHRRTKRGAHTCEICGVSPAACCALNPRLFSQAVVAEDLTQHHSLARLSRATRVPAMALGGAPRASGLTCLLLIAGACC